MLRNVKDAWFRSMVQLRDDVVGIDAAILSPPAIWEASGHLENFTDPMVDCRKCKERFREDQLEDPGHVPQLRGQGQLHRGPAVQPDVQDVLRAGRGPTPQSPTSGPRRPRACFVNFKNVLTTTRKKPPFGIAQIGKSFRNEITPGNFIFRTREFEQMEMEFFVPPAEAPPVARVLVQRAAQLVRDLGIPRDKLRLRGPRRRRAVALLGRHLRRRVPLPVGMGRARGHRQPHRLRPEPARQALGRAARVLRPGQRRALRPPRDRAGGRGDPHDDGVPARRLRRGGGAGRAADRSAAAPPDRAVPGRRAAAVEERAPGAGSREVFDMVKPHFMTEYDETQSIGRRYRRQDEIGTPTASPSTSTPSTTRPSPSASATRWSRCGSRSTRSSTSCAGGSGLATVTSCCSSGAPTPRSARFRGAVERQLAGGSGDAGARGRRVTGVAARRRDGHHRGRCHAE